MKVADIAKKLYTFGKTYSRTDESITLYDVPNTPTHIAQIKAIVGSFTPNYSLILVSPKGAETNVKIVNIKL